ncbi:MAG TPA: type II secretion system protein, partial [Phycisphaerales bacterium]|nr:type II secretion system protein [Phycisphaerales bacterium]
MPSACVDPPPVVPGRSPAVPRRRGKAAVRPSAFTLVEMVLAMAIAAILIGAMGGAIAITTRAIDGGEDRNARASRAIDAAGVIAEDLRTATAVTATGGTSVEM